MLLLSGDIPSNPVPAGQHKYPCTVCSEGVRNNSKAFDCDICTKWTYLACQHQTNREEYNNAMKGDGSLNFVCEPCLMAELPNISLENSFLDQAEESFHLDDSHGMNSLIVLSTGGCTSFT